MRCVAARRAPGQPRVGAGRTVADARQRSSRHLGNGLGPPPRSRLRAARSGLRQGGRARMSSHRRHDTGAGAEAAAREQPPDIATASLPPEVYLIGCSGDPASDSQPSAETMGFKAWNLLRMAQLSLPVPAAFVIGTHYCMDPTAREVAAQPDLWKAGLDALQ